MTLVQIELLSEWKISFIFPIALLYYLKSIIKYPLANYPVLGTEIDQLKDD